MELAGFRALAKKVDRSLSFEPKTRSGRLFWVLTKKNGDVIDVMHRRRGQTQADELLRIERKPTVQKASALVRNMGQWKRDIKSLPEPGFTVKRRKTKDYIERTTFTGFPKAFDHHHLFLTCLICACVRYDRPE